VSGDADSAGLRLHSENAALREQIRELVVGRRAWFIIALVMVAGMLATLVFMARTDVDVYYVTQPGLCYDSVHDKDVVSQCTHPDHVVEMIGNDPDADAFVCRCSRRKVTP
jgi:hypothetical protein